MSTTPHLKEKKSTLTVALFLLMLISILFSSSDISAQVDAYASLNSWGKTKDGRYALCHNASFKNDDPLNDVCSPQIALDLSAYPSITDVVIVDLVGSNFDITDVDTSTSGFSASNLNGNVIDPLTIKCLRPGEGVYLKFIVYADPAVWGDATTFNWTETVSGNNTLNGFQTNTDNDLTEEMYDSDVILGGALDVFQGANDLSYGANIEPNIDGTYDFKYRVTIANYQNDANTGGLATIITYNDDLNHIYDNMPINSISVSNSANGRLTVNPNYTGKATVIGGTSVIPDDMLISAGTLNPDEEDYVEIILNVGPIDLSQKNWSRWTTGRVYAYDNASNSLEGITTEGQDPAAGQANGPAVTCTNGFDIRFDYRAYLEVTKVLTDAIPAASGTAGNFDLSYEITVLADDDNDVNMYWLAAQDEIADAFGSNFVSITSTPVVTNSNATSPPLANGSFNGLSSGNINLLSGSTYNMLEPGQSFKINYTVEVASTGLETELINNVSVSGSNSLDQAITYQESSSYFLLKDSDIDGIRNDIDIDDDNDGILDINESADNFSSFISWSHNQTDPYIADIDSPKITDWGLTNVQTEFSASGLSAVVTSSHLRIQGIESKTLQESIWYDEYITYAFTTSNEVEDMTITTMFSGIYEDGTSLHGDSYKLGLLFSDDGFNTWSVLSSNVDHTDTNGSANSDRFTYFDGVNNPSLILKPNTTYEIRMQFYDVVDDNATRDYVVFDDFLIGITALQSQNSDADGIPDYLDFDSDDDGCVDAVEAGHTDPDNDGILGNSPVTVASNGSVIGQGGYTGTNARVTTPNAIINFTSHPSDITIFVGSNAFFGTNISDSGLTYQWEESLNEGGNWNPITDGGIYSGSTTGYLTLIGVTDNLDTNDYRLVVSDSGNLCGVTTISNSANLTVLSNDNDNDTIADAVDLDDDNDGILDSEEISDKLRSYQAPEGSSLASYYVYQFSGSSDAVNFYREPQLLAWMFDSAPSDLLYNGITDVFSGAQKNLSDIEALTFAEAKSNGEYFQSTFTTGTDLVDPYLRQVHIEWDFNNVADDYSARLEVIVGGVVVYTSPEKRVSSTTADFTSGTRGFYLVKPDLASHWLQLSDNTTYTVRTYLYDVDASSSTADYVIIDDATYRFSAALARDTDGDTIFDHLDDDSDADGCVDAIEAGHTDPDADGYLGTSPVTVDVDGLVTGQGGYTGTTGNEIIATEVSINTAPSNQSANDGSSASFSIDASAINTTNFSSGTPIYSGSGSSNSTANIEYQWQENGTNLANGGVYSGFNSNTLNISDVTGLNGNTYTVLLTHTNNNCYAESRSAALSALNPCNPITSGNVDTDGDGVSDVCDLDDDNDGILDTEECVPATSSGLTGPLSGFSTDITTTNANSQNVPHILNSITYNGVTYTDFIVPDSYSPNFSLTDDTGVSYLQNGSFLFSMDSNPNYNIDILPAFQSRDLGSYQDLERNDFSDGDYFDLIYNLPILSTAGGFVAVTERGGNNEQVVQALDINGNVVGSTITVSTSDYVDLGVLVDPGGPQNAMMALYPIDNLAAVGTEIYGLRISFGTSSTANSDGPDTKAFFFGNLNLLTCDFDGDGIPNTLDPDSDNDGCVDTIEAGHTDGDNDGFLGNSPVTVGISGLVTGQGGYTGVTGNEIVATQVTINNPPANQSSNTGTGTTFTIDATAINTTTFSSGSPNYSGGTDSSAQLQYQWQENGTNLANGGVYSGVNSGTLNISDVTGLNGNTYTVLLTHTNNNCYAENRSATLNTVNPCDPVSSGNVDTDGDGVSDICDEDDDNDGILDTDEGGCQGAYEAPYVYTTNLDVLSNTIIGPDGVTSIGSINTSGNVNSSGFGGPGTIDISSITDPDAVSWFYESSHASVQTTLEAIWISVTPILQEYTGTGTEPNYVPDTSRPPFVGRLTGSNASGSVTSLKLTYPDNTPIIFESTGGDGLYRRAFTSVTVDYGIIRWTDNGDNTWTNEKGFTQTGAPVGLIFNPCSIYIDTDNDGIPDYLDTDSDNDGCFDTIEAGHTDGDNDGILGNSPVAVDANGLVTGQGGYTGVTGNEIIATQVIVDLAPIDVTVNNGDSASFSIGLTAVNTIGFNSGTPDYSVAGSSDSSSNLQYQWQENGSNLTNGGIYSGVNTNELAISNVTGLNGNTYSVIVTHSNNLCYTSSANASLNVNPDITIDDSSTVEGTDNVFTITASHSVNQDIVFDIVYNNITTTDPDYNGPSTIILLANTTSISFNVATIDDNLIEATETHESVTSYNSGPTVTISDDIGIGEILDNDAPGAGEGISVADFTVNEDAGTADFVVTYTGPTVADAFTVDYIITDGSAITSLDYSVAAATGNVSFPAGTIDGTTQVVTITIIDDVLLEGPEDLNITLSNISNPLLNLVDADGVGTITDNDGGGAGDGISVADFTVNENVGTVDFVVTYTGPTVADAFTVDFAVADGTAISPDDYTVAAATGNVSFPANTATGTTQTVTVTILDDTLLETSEDLNITLSNISNVLIAMLDADGVGTITDNEMPGANDGISVADFTVNENVGAVDFIITYTGPTVADAFTVDFAVADGTAISPDDYTVAVATGNVSFPANTTTGTTQTVTITIINDALIESAEELNITLSNISNASIALVDGDGIGVINDDDIDLDADDDGILDSFEDLNADGDNDPATNPTNSDDDAYPDYLDIDSDDDGIPDNVEAQTTSGYIPPSLIDANGNGVDDAYETGTEIGIIPVNTDGEDLPDYLDDDSDNDNVPDNIEAHDYNQDGVADVVLIGSDKDNDGLDDSFEGIEQIDIDINDEIDDPINDLPNTDGDDESDYRDLDDDGDGIPTIEEDVNEDMDYSNDDWDNDGIPDYLDPDQEEEIDAVEIFNVVTPNNDMVHDFLMITGLELRPDNNLKIYNRWGILVYSTASYNTEGNVFDGTSQARVTIGKDDRLPVGTYFYLFDYVEVTGERVNLSGHLYLN
jgi:gliding motility-associated-like protein